MNINLLEGMPGEPIPYLLRSDWMMTTIMFFCILLVSFVLSRGNKNLQKQLKSLFYYRERNNLFDKVTTEDANSSFLLVLNTCIMLSFCAYHYLSQNQPLLIEKVPHSLLLGSLTLCTILFLIYKWITYSFINWIFFQKAKNILWMTTFFNLTIWVGILLIPIILLIVYFDLSFQTAIYPIGFVIIFSKIILLWTCFKNFFDKFHGAFHLILYFCALEILPDLILWKGMELMNNNLILNF